MGKAARAIIIENGKILVMHRSKHGSQYYTLVGGRANDGESIEQALVREVKEETGLDVTECRQVFYEKHPEPYNEQYIFLCKIGPHGNVEIQDTSEEGAMNRHQANMHTPGWADLRTFAGLPFRTPQLQEAITTSLKKGFPSTPIQL